MNDEEILAAAEEAKKTSLFKRSKEQQELIARANNIKLERTQMKHKLEDARRVLKKERIRARDAQIEFVSEVDETDLEAMKAEAERLKALRKSPEGKAQTEGARLASRERARKAKEAQKARAEAEEAKLFPHRTDSPPDFFEGVSLVPAKGWIIHRGVKHALPARATVESVGEMRRRITLTRAVAFGAFSLALKKKQDDRELFLTVEGDGWAFVVDVDPKLQRGARMFAASVNSA